MKLLMIFMCKDMYDEQSLTPRPRKATTHCSWIQDSRRFLSPPQNYTSVTNRYQLTLHTRGLRHTWLRRALRMLVLQSIRNNTLNIHLFWGHNVVLMFVANLGVFSTYNKKSSSHYFIQLGNKLPTILLSIYSNITKAHLEIATILRAINNCCSLNKSKFSHIIQVK